MPVTDWKIAGTGANDSSVGNSAWSNPGNIVASNDTRATTGTMGAGQSSQILVATNFGFTNIDIPDGSTITGIEINVERQRNSTGPNQVQDLQIQLRKSTGVVGQNKAVATNWPNNDAIAAYGAEGDLWLSLPAFTQSEILHTGFGVHIRCQRTGGTAASGGVDAVQIRVYYTQPDINRNADIAANGPIPIADLSALLSVAESIATISAAMPLPVSGFSAQHIPPQFPAAIAAIGPLPITNIQVQVTSAEFIASISATIPLPDCAIYCTVKPPVFTANKSAAIPLPIALSSATNEAPTFVAIVSANITPPIASIVSSAAPPDYIAFISAVISLPVSNAGGQTIAPEFLSELSAQIHLPSVLAEVATTAPTYLIAISTILPLPNATVQAEYSSRIYLANLSASMPVPQYEGSILITNPEYAAIVDALMPNPDSSMFIQNTARQCMAFLEGHWVAGTLYGYHSGRWIKANFIK